MPRLDSKARILFVNPYYRGVSNFVEAGFWGRRLYSSFPLGVGLLASLTPRDEFSVSLINEHWDERVDYQEEAEIVALSFMTCNTPRAYEIADQFRSRGKLVVMGGLHASACVAEAAQHADVIFVGEGEETWPQFLRDFRAGQVKPVYRAPRPVPPELIPCPDRVMAKRNRKLHKISVIASRGCPHGCDFCTLTTFFGRQVRCRPISHVIGEIQEAVALEGNQVKMLLFKDDNFIIDKEYTHELVEQLIPLKMTWAAQVDLKSLADRETVKLMKRSGCVLVAVGMESANPGTGSRFGKTFDDVEKMREVISFLHQNNIFIWGSYIFGFDEDTPDSFERIYHQAKYLDIDILSIGIYTPFPGSALYEKMNKENRIIEKRWEYYDLEHPVFEPKNLSPYLLKQRQSEILKRFYSKSEFFKRMGKVLFRVWQSGRVVPIHYYFIFNLMVRTILQKY